MRRSALAVGLCLIVAFGVVHAQSTPPPRPPAATRDASVKLPVRRVVIYKNGVGYFEHVGRIRGNQTVTIDFNSSQLNDVLKSLTTLDLGDGRITNISFNSEAPFAQRLGALRLPLGEQTTLAQFLGALRGARFDVRGGGQDVSGRLLSVEQRQQGRGADAVMRDEITLVTDAGDVRTVTLTPAVSVKLAERDSADQVGRYLGLLASTRAQDQRRMAISAAGSGERDLLVSYVSETPIWKTTYRIVLPTKAGGKTLLQGWAIVDNTIGEDWSDVELSLVAGAPQSFIQQISQPQYARRPVVPLPSAVNLTPQTHEATLTDESSAEKSRDAIEPPASPVPAPPPAARFSGYAGGVVGGVVGGIAAAPSRSDIEAKMAREFQPAAQAQELGDLFEYKIKGPVTIRKNQSALVPIVASEIGAQRVSLWNEQIGGTRPLRSLWITNASGLTLDGGSFTVLDESTFAGEGLIDPLKPAEKRLVSYAVDLGVLVEARRGDQKQQIARIRIVRGVAVQQSEQRTERVYTIRNNDTSPRTVVIEHPVRAGWTLTGGANPTETSASTYRFAIAVDPRKDAKLSVAEVHPEETRVVISSLTDDQITMFIKGAGDSEALARALAPVTTAKAAIAAIARDIAARQGEVNRIGDDQARVRENMKSLKGTSEEQQLVRRYAAQLNQQEDRLEALRRELADLEQKRQRAQADLAQLLESLTLDVEVGGRS